MSVLSKAKQLNKEFKNDNLGILADIVPVYKRLSCGDLGIDYPLYGGVPLGRALVFSGLEGSGKTVASCVVMSAYQRMFPDKICVFVDVEHSLDLNFIVQATGIDTTKMLYVNPENMSGEQILDYIAELQEEEDIGMIIMDSIPALASEIELQNDVATNKGKVANMANSLHRFYRRMVPMLSSKGNILVMINQVRVAGITPTGAIQYSEPGGDAPRYYSSVKVRFGRRTFTKEDVVDMRDGETADGFRLQFAVTKNKTAPTSRGGGFLTFRYGTGLDWLFDTLEVALKYDVISKTGNTYFLSNLITGEAYDLGVDETTGKPIKIVGKRALKEYLSSHPEFQKEYLNMLNDFICKDTTKDYGSLLDERELQFLKAQDKSVSKEDPERDEQEYKVVGE